MKWIAIVAAVLLALPVGFIGAVYAASELGGEVVVLHRPAADGTSTVRIWIVEDETGTWIEHGGADPSWMHRLAQDPTLEIERGGETISFRAAEDPASHARYHALRQAKYGWADDFVALASGDPAECDGVPLRLDPSD